MKGLAFVYDAVECWHGSVPTPFVIASLLLLCTTALALSRMPCGLWINIHVRSATTTTIPTTIVTSTTASIAIANALLQRGWPNHIRSIAPPLLLHTHPFAGPLLGGNLVSQCQVQATQHLQFFSSESAIPTFLVSSLVSILT